MSTIVQQRRGTQLEWFVSNPILAMGEIGYEIDTNNFKVGNGISDWNSLTYFKAVSLEKPFSPDSGEIWLDPDSAKLYVFFQNSWVEA